MPTERRPRWTRTAAVVALGALALLPAAATAQPAGDEPADDDAPALPPGPTAVYFAELERLGLVDAATGSKTTLTRELAAAEALLRGGAAAEAAVALYTIVESPRYTDFSDFVEYQNAEYYLGVALHQAGAPGAALAAFERVLGRGPDAPYWGPAHRRAVDIAIETRDFAGVLARVGAGRARLGLPQRSGARGGRGPPGPARARGPPAAPRCAGGGDDRQRVGRVRPVPRSGTRRPCGCGAGGWRRAGAAHDDDRARRLRAVPLHRLSARPLWPGGSPESLPAARRFVYTARLCLPRQRTQGPRVCLPRGAAGRRRRVDRWRSGGRGGADGAHAWASVGARGDGAWPSW